jgi:TIR domain
MLTLCHRTHYTGERSDTCTHCCPNQLQWLFEGGVADRSAHVSGESDTEPVSAGDAFLAEGDLGQPRDDKEHFIVLLMRIGAKLTRRGNMCDRKFRPVAYIRSLIVKPIDYYSCFISYSSKDDTFARRLYADLQSNNVRCWFAPEDLKWGTRIHTGIDEAIRLHDKLLLILSKYSVASGWVEHEVKTALAREHKEKRTVLFPVRIDKAILMNPSSWATEIRHERNIGNFSSWKIHDEYQKAFTRLLHDLKAEV